MEYLFFYSSVVVVLIIFVICCIIRNPKLSNILIGLITIGYSLVSDIILGDQLKLFYYISPQASTLYMILSAVFIYSLLNIVYTMFLPGKGKKAFIYTLCWTIALLLFEYVSIVTKSIVFTGWRPIPWSLVIYLVAYLWIYFFYRYLNRKIPDKEK